MAIVTNIDQLSRYCNNQVVLDYVQRIGNDSADRMRILELALGSFEKFYFSKNLFALEHVMVTKTRSDCFWESHRHYIDIQIIVEGREEIEHLDISKLVTKTPYDLQKDLIVYEDGFGSNRLVLQKGDIAVFFPEDAHMALLQFDNTPSTLYKSVIKLPVGEWL